MKKHLLTMLALAVSAMVANADKVAFVAAGITYTGDATQVIELPCGFDATVFPLTSDAVMFSGFTGTTTNSYVSSGALRWYSGATATITPAKGVTVTKITVTCQAASYAKAISSAFTVSTDNSLVQTCTATITEPVTVKSGSQVRCTVIEVEYTGTPVKIPEIKADTKYLLPADKKVTISAADGAKIYYTLDGTEPTTESTPYTEPFALEKSSYVRAIAVTDAGTSYVATKGYVIVPAGLLVDSYNFVDISTLNTPGHNLADEWDSQEGSNRKIAADGMYFLSGKTRFEAATDSSTVTKPYLFKSATFGNFVHFRLGSGNTATFSVTDEDYYIAAVAFFGGYLNATGVPDSSVTNTHVAYGDENGDIEYESIYKSGTSATAVWTAKEGVKNNSVKLKAADGLTTSNTQYFEEVYIYYAPKSESGIEGVAVDNSNAPVEYYNLQGVRVANPTSGIYVKRQGNSATKILVK